MRLRTVPLLALALFAASVPGAEEFAADVHHPPLTGGDVTFIEFFFRGGRAMWPLLLVAIAGAGHAAYCGWKLRMSRQAPRELDREVVRLVDQRGVDVGRERCVNDPSALGRVLHAALLRYGRTPAEMERAVCDEVRRLHVDFLCHTNFIAALAIASTLLGTLGLCLSLMQYFDSNSGIPTLADAMISPACGLGLSVVLCLIYFHFRVTADLIARTVETRAIDAVLTLDRKARQSIRQIADIQEHLPTKDMPAVKLDLEKELESVGREGSDVRTSITTHPSLPATGN